jgi:hypothetical protein
MLTRTPWPAIILPWSSSRLDALIATKKSVIFNISLLTFGARFTLNRHLTGLWVHQIGFSSTSSSIGNLGGNLGKSNASYNHKCDWH